jgi:hypothetical protein
MQEASAPVKPEQLGVLGEHHFRSRISSGDGSTFRYKRITGEASGLPFVIGINSSVPLRNPLQQTWLGGQYGLAALDGLVSSEYPVL